jgi:hypothetical protein
VIDEEDIDDAITHIKHLQENARRSEQRSIAFNKKLPPGSPKTAHMEHVIASTNLRLRWDRTLTTVEDLVAHYRDHSA